MRRVVAVVEEVLQQLMQRGAGDVGRCCGIGSKLRPDEITHTYTHIQRHTDAHTHTPATA